LDDRSSAFRYARLRDSYPDVLVRRFEATKIKSGDLLGQLVQSQKIAVCEASEAGRSTGAAVTALY